jgi:hypothetical protein
MMAYLRDPVELLQSLLKVCCSSEGKGETMKQGGAVEPCSRVLVEMCGKKIVSSRCCP